MGFGSKTFEQLKAEYPRHYWDSAYREKMYEKLRSLPEEKQLAIIRAQMREREKKNSLLNVNKFSVKGFTDVNKCFPFNSDPLSPSEYYQNLQNSCMDFAKLAIQHYNKHNDNKSEEFKAVIVESMDFTGGVIWHHVMKFTAKDAKDPSAAILTFQADVTLDKDRKTEVVYCNRI
ncbi:hypothetical protein OROGR_003848 [Orobanche gracilis]